MGQFTVPSEFKVTPYFSATNLAAEGSLKYNFLVVPLSVKPAFLNLFNPLKPPFDTVPHVDMLEPSGRSFAIVFIIFCTSSEEYAPRFVLKCIE